MGLPADASDSEFVGASPSQGRDALVAAARQRLEPVLAAHGLHSRESWLVDHELKSALGRLLAAATHSASPPARELPQAAPTVRPAAPAGQTRPPTAPETRSKPPLTPPPSQEDAAAVRRAPLTPRRDAPQIDLNVARALYVRRTSLGRAMLGMAMSVGRGTQEPGEPGPQPAGSLDGPPGAAGDAAHDVDSAAAARLRSRSRARVVAATVAVLSAIGLVIEIAYVPVHLQRLRATTQPQDDRSAPGSQSPGPAPAPATRALPAPAAQPSVAGDVDAARSATETAAGASGAVPAPAGNAQAARPPMPIPAPALPADAAPEQQRPAPAEADPIDPTLRKRLDRLREQWVARMASSVEAQRAAKAIDPESMRWLAQAKLLERLIALDDIAQLLIEARADDAEPLIDVMPVLCAVGEVPREAPAETSAREDGRLVSDLSRAGGGGESRLAVLRAYRSLPIAPGRADARALVSEALGGPSRNSRALALAILLERGGSSVAVLEAVHARVAELAATPAARAVVEQLAGEVPGGAPIDAQALRARLARKILAGRGATMHLIDATADATAAMLDRMARRADPQVAPADMESSLATLARAASRDSAPARLDGASGPLQRMVASLTALERARIVRNYRRLPNERTRIDSAAAETSARTLAAGSSLEQAIEVAIGLLSQDAIALGATPAPRLPSAEVPPAAASAALASPMRLPAPSAESLAKWPQAARALTDDGSGLDGDALIRIAEDVQDSSADDGARSIAARLYARAALAGTEATAASAARGLASLVAPGSALHASERHRWESIAAQYALADAAMRGPGQPSRRAAAAIGVESDASSRIALADALALCVSGYGRQAGDRLQSPTVRALAQRISDALPGGFAGLEALCEGRTPSSPQLEPPVADQLLAVEAALREPRSTRWSDDLAMRRGLPLVSIDTASRAARIGLFTPAPAPGPQ